MNRTLLGGIMAGAVAYTGCAGSIIVRTVWNDAVELALEKEKVTVILTESACVWKEEPKKVDHLAGLDADVRISTRYIDEKCDGHIDRISKDVYKVEKVGIGGYLNKPIDNWIIERNPLEIRIMTAPIYGSDAQFYEAVESNKAKQGLVSTTVDLYLEFDSWDQRAAELMKKYELQKVKEYLLKNK